CQPYGLFQVCLSQDSRDAPVSALEYGFRFGVEKVHSPRFPTPFQGSWGCRLRRSNTMTHMYPSALLCKSIVLSTCPGSYGHGEKGRRVDCPERIRHLIRLSRSPMPS